MCQVKHNVILIKHQVKKSLSMASESNTSYLLRGFECEHTYLCTLWISSAFHTLIFIVNNSWRNSHLYLEIFFPWILFSIRIHTYLMVNKFSSWLISEESVAILLIWCLWNIFLPGGSEGHKYTLRCDLYSSKWAVHGPTKFPTFIISLEGAYNFNVYNTSRKHSTLYLLSYKCWILHYIQH